MSASRLCYRDHLRLPYARHVGRPGACRRRAGAVAAVACAAFATTSACGGDNGGGHAEPLPASISVRSAAFGDGDTIPRWYTCDGAGDIPPLSWSKPPARVQALALLVDDPDSPNGAYTHWAALDLPRNTRELRGRVPAKAHETKNSAGSVGWTPPCPPKGDSAHHYRFSVYALSKPTHLTDGAGVAAVRAAIDRLAIAHGRLVGTYARTG